MADQITASIVDICKRQKYEPVLITIINESNKMMVRKSMDGNNSDDLEIMMSLAKIKDDKLTNPPNNGVLITDTQFNTNIGMVLIWGSGSSETDQTLAAEGVATLDFPNLGTNPQRKNEKMDDNKKSSMPRTNSEFFMWFNEEQQEPVKINLAPSNSKVENAVMPRTMSEMFIWNTDQTDYPKSTGGSMAGGSRRGSLADFEGLDEAALEAELAKAKMMAKSNSKEYFIWNTDENGEEKPRTIAIIPAEAVNNMGRSPSKSSMTGSIGKGMPRSNSEYYIWESDEKDMRKMAREQGVFMTPSGSMASMANSNGDDEEFRHAQQQMSSMGGMQRSNSEYYIWYTDEPDSELIKVTIKPTNTNLDNAVLPRSNSEYYIWNTDLDEVENKIEKQNQQQGGPYLKMSNDDIIPAKDYQRHDKEEHDLINNKYQNQILMSELEKELDDLIYGNQFGNIKESNKDTYYERKNLMSDFEHYMNNQRSNVNRKYIRN